MFADLLAPPLCWSCRSPALRGRPLCRACRARLRFLPPGPVLLAGVRVWAPVSYEGPARDLVKALKFHAATRLADELVALVAANAPRELLTGTLVPVPPYTGRVRKRGVDQAKMLAQAIGQRCDLPCCECLERRGPRTRQVGRGRAERLSGPTGSIAASAAVPRRALLVDDVVTTGATLAACARALRRAGAEEVAAIAFARTVGR